MDQTGGTPSLDQQKKEVLEKVVDQLINSFEKKEISIKTMKQAAEFTLTSLQNVTDEPSLMEFLKALSSKWNIFKHLTSLYIYPAQQAAEKQVIEKLSSYINTLQN